MEVTQAQLAEIIGVTSRQVRTYATEGLPSRGSGGRKRYDLGASVRWWCARQVARAVERATPSGLIAAKSRKETALAELRELEVAQRRGELVEVADMLEVWRENFGTIRAEILRLPARFGDVVVGLDTPAAGEDALERVANDVLRSLHVAFAEPEVVARG